jgi:hypothetical protein
MTGSRRLPPTRDLASRHVSEAKGTARARAPRSSSTCCHGRGLHGGGYTWLFAAVEAAIVAVAEKHGLDTQKQHWKKAEVAKELRRSGALLYGFSDTLQILNQARKVAIYEGEEPELDGHSLEDIAADVEAAVECAEQEEGDPTQ